MDSNEKIENCDDCHCKHIKGVSCDVHNCVHNNGERYCTAEMISVGPVDANCCSETVCATFRQKEE